MKRPCSAFLFAILALGVAVPALVALDSHEPPEPAPAVLPDLPVIKLRPEPVRAVQVLSLDCSSWAQVEDRLKRFHEAGVNTVIVRVFQNPGDILYEFARPRSAVGVYFQTDEAPVVDDILGPLCTLAHRNDLELFAWMTTRYTDYGMEDRTELFCRAYDLGRKEYVRARGLSVILPEVKTRLVRLYRDMARYPIDGILVQDDLILRHNEDFNPRVMRIYQLSTGKESLPSRFYQGIYRDYRGRFLVQEYTPDFWAWARWKRDRLLDVADELRRVALAQRPELKFGINFYYETATDPEHGLAWFSQELEAAALRNYDFYAIMLYHRQMQKELGLSKARCQSLLKEGAQYACKVVGNPGKVLLKMQTVDWDRGVRIPNSEMSEVFSVLKQEPRTGWALIPAGPGLDLTWVSQQYH
jgi:biofilm PGA synthesis lipoprotein PgaB